MPLRDECDFLERLGYLIGLRAHNDDVIIFL